MFAEKKWLAGNLIYLEGREPRSGLAEGDVASSLLYKKDGTVYVIDTGCGRRFRRSLVGAIEALRPFSGLCVLNTHSHPDHTANNGIIREIDCTRKRHYISGRGRDGLDYVRSFARVTGSLKPWCTVYEVMSFPWSLLIWPFVLWSHVHPRGHEHFIAGTIAKFKPLDPSPETAEDLESLPSAAVPSRSPFGERYSVDDAVVAIPTRGHSPDHVAFYIPEHRVLFTADETFSIYPLWPDSDSARTGDAIDFFRDLVGEGAIDIVADSHTPGIMDSSMATALFSRRIDAHRAFLDEFRQARAMEGSLPDIHRIYRSMTRRYRASGRRNGANGGIRRLLGDYFDMEFPRMPVYLKVVLASLLNESEKGRVGT